MVTALVLVLLGAELFVRTPESARADVPFPFTPTADSYVDASRPTKNYGSRSNMRVDANPDRTSYVKFDVQGAGVPSGATLRVFAETSNNVGFDVYEVLDTTWDESTLTYSNAPALGALLGSSGPVAGGSLVSLDVSGAVAGDGLVTLAIKTTSSTATRITTKEGANPPELWIPAPPSASPYTVTRSGTTYTATGADASTITGSLKDVVESAASNLNSGGGGSVVFLADTYDLGNTWWEFDNLSDIVFEGAGMGQTIITNNASASTDTEPFDMTASDDITIRDLTVDANGPARSTSDAIDFDGGDNVLIERVEITSSRARGIIFDGKGSGSLSHADGNIVRDCSINGVPGDGIELLASNNNAIEGCTITNVGGYGIRLSKSSSSATQPNKPSNDNVVTGNTIDQAGSHGIFINSSNRNQIVGNTVINSSNVTSGRDGIRIDSNNSQACDDNVVDTNIAIDNQNPKTQRYGLNIGDALCNRTVVSDNDFSGNLSGDIRDLGTDTQYSSSDVDPPTVPTNVRTDAVVWNQVDLAWDASTDNVGVTEYTVIRDGSPIATVDGATLTYEDTSVQASTTHLYAVSAGDAAGNVSAASSPALQVDTPPPPSAVTLVPVADSYVHASNPTRNYGSSSQIRVDASPDVRGYLRFDVPAVSGTVSTATLRIYANSGSSVGFDVSGVADNTWTEPGIDYTSAPAFGAVAGSTGSFSGGTWHEFDVTSLVSAGAEVSFGVGTPHTTAVSLASRESSNSAELVIATTP